MITSKDIQPQRVRSDSHPNNDNKIRHAWVMTMDEKTKNQIISKFPNQKSRFSLYKYIDDKVSDEWINQMRTSFKKSVDEGAKLFEYPNGCIRLEDYLCGKADDKLIVAAEVVVAEVAEAIDNPLNINSMVFQ